MDRNEVNYVLHFARQGALSWVGHLDLMRTLERLFRRADLPIVYSEGFNPRPRFNFALPLGVGIACRDDLLELTVSRPLPLEETLAALQAQCPQGLTIEQLEPAEASAESLMARVRAARYDYQGKGIGRLFTAMQQEHPEITIEKKNRRGTRQIPLFSLLRESRVQSEDHLQILASAGQQDNLRPDFVLDALCRLYPAETQNIRDCQISRLGLCLHPAQVATEALPGNVAKV